MSPRRRGAGTQGPILGFPLARERAKRAVDGGAILTHLSRVAFIGNSLPRRCGIATFTTDLQQAIAASSAQMETSIVAMTDHGHAYDYASVVRVQINDDKIEDYVRAADF